MHLRAIGSWSATARALTLENVGDDKFPNLQTREVFQRDNPPTHDQGTDAPGRSFQSVGDARSTVEQTDWHEKAERDFLFAQALNHSPNAGGAVAVPPFSTLTVSPSSSDQDRFKTIMDGLRMFSDNPVLGRGLGAYVAEQNKTPYTVIHSTPVWLMAEMGLIGLLAFLAPAFRIFQIEARQVQSNAVSSVIVFMLLAFAMMSAVHEMLYQRPLWLLLGAALSLTSFTEAKEKGSGNR